MKIFVILLFVSSSVFAKDTLNDFNKKLMENFDKDIKSDNDFAVKKDRGPARGPASVAPEADPQNITEEKKLDKSIRQTGHRAW